MLVFQSQMLQVLCTMSEVHSLYIFVWYDVCIICYTVNPSIDSFVGTISGLGTDDGCSRPGAPSGNFDLCPLPGEDVTLTCSASGSTSIMTPGGTSVSSPHIISSITDSAEGVYTCVASNSPCNDTTSTLTIMLGTACELHDNDKHIYM